jgi:hypothetical protein
MNQHWLERPSTIRRLWIAFVATLATTVAAELFVERHSVFGLDGSFGFYAWFGFASCVGLILFPKLLGVFLKRPDSYYGD